MSTCEKLENCPFYKGQLIVENGLGKVLISQYCLKNKENCARYKVITELGPDYVDNTLFPHMMNKAYMILAENSKN